MVWNLTLKSDVIPTNAQTMFSSTKVATFSIRDTTGQVKTFHGDRMRHEQHPGIVETPVLAHDTRTLNFQQELSTEERRKLLNHFSQENKKYLTCNYEITSEIVVSS